MKNFIENSIKYHTGDLNNILDRLFCTLGNGISLDNKGYLEGNYKGKESYSFPDPTPFKDWIYPWDSNPKYQPFRKYAGCRDVGFKDTCEYFISCLEITPDEVENISEWKENIPLIREVLLDTPTIEDEFTINDMDKFLDKIKHEKVTDQHPVDPSYHSEEPESSVRKVWYFDVQWSDCPLCVEDEVESAWRSRELGNDNYIWKVNLDEELFDDYPHVYFWLKHKGVEDNEMVIIHWWW